MFYIGSNVQNWPLQAMRAIADGHEICVHTWSHPYMTAVDSEGAFAELYYAVSFSPVFRCLSTRLSFLLRASRIFLLHLRISADSFPSHSYITLLRLANVLLTHSAK